MKIWCVDHACLGWSVHSELFFRKEDAEYRDNHYAAINGAYHKMYQVEDIWGWCGRNFDFVISEVLASRDSDDDFTYIYGMVEELREAAVHCGVREFSADMIIIREDFDNSIRDYALSIAWIDENKGLIHRLYHIEGLDTPYDYPTIVERRSKWQK